MTAALSIFGIPPALTIAIVAVIMVAMILQGRYWTWEKIAMLFCSLNLVYIPAAFLVHPSVGSILTHGIIPGFPGGFTGELVFIPNQSIWSGKQKPEEASQRYSC